MSESEASAARRDPTSASTCASSADPATPPGAARWTPVCRLDELAPDTGACALVAGRQVAVFRVGDAAFAIDQYDPVAGAHVLSRGLVSHRGDTVAVASPLHKHRFCLRTGACLDDPTARVVVWPCRVRAGVVEVATEIGARGQDATAWLERYREIWEGSFQRLDALLDELQRPPRPRGKPRTRRRR